MIKEKGKNIVGAEAIMHTPFNDDYSVDYKGIRTLIRHMIDGGLVEGNGVILVNGAVGEFHSLTINERKEIAEVALEEANGKVPIIINASHTYPKIVIDLAKHAEKNGAYALQVSPPYYMPLSDIEIVKFYQEISDNTSIGMMIYADYWASQAYFDNIMDELVEIENVVAMKWKRPDQDIQTNTVLEFGDRIAFMDNGRAMGVWSHMIGMKGFISQMAVFGPKIAVKKWEMIQNKEWDKAAKYLVDVEVPFFEVMQDVMKYGIKGEGTLLKECSRLLDLPAGPNRPPHDIEVPNEFTKRLEALLEKANLL